MCFSSTAPPSSFARITSRYARIRSIITASTVCQSARCGCFRPSFCSSSAMGRRESNRPIWRSFSTSRKNSFRREIYPSYKTHRPDPPADLLPQFPLMRATVRAFGMVPVEQDRYEADDLIATYARQARERGADVLIVSADKDLMQLIEPRVAMYDPASGEREERKIGLAEVIEYFGAGPDKVVDIQALAGDFDRQYPRSAGDRRQDRGAADQRIWRPRDPARSRRRDQAAEAPRSAHPAGEHRAHPPVEVAGHPGSQCRGGNAAR